MCKIISVTVPGGALKCQSNRIGQNNNLQAKNKCRGEKNEENRLFSLLILDIGQFDFYLSFKKKTPLATPNKKIKKKNSMPIQYPQFDAKKGYPKDENFFFSFQKEGRQKALDKKRSSFTSWELTLAIQYSH